MTPEPTGPGASETVGPAGHQTDGAERVNGAGRAGPAADHVTGVGDVGAAGYSPREPAELAGYLDVELDHDLLTRALTHRSYAYEHGGLPHNERLEFLGDSVLGIVVTHSLYLTHPDVTEGKLAKMRASVVNMRALADVARGIGPDGLGAYVLLGRGEDVTGGRDKASILADTVEALLGAVYLQLGLDGADRVVHALFDPLLAEVARHGAGLDWKTSLQELTAELGIGVPEYQITAEGPDHAKTFTARAQVGARVFGARTGQNKKQAEQAAAEAAYLDLSGRAATADAPESPPA